MTPEMQQALERTMQGRPQPGDDRILRDALLRLPPSGKDYKIIAAVVGKESGSVIGGNLPTVSGGQPFYGSAPASNATRSGYGFNEEQQNPGALTPTRDFMQGWGTPTWDFMEGAGEPGFMTPTGDFMQGPGSLLQGLSPSEGTKRSGVATAHDDQFPDIFLGGETLTASVPDHNPSVAEEMAANQAANQGTTNAPPTTPTKPKGWSTGAFDQLHRATGQDLQTDVQGEDFPDPGMTIDPGGNMSFSGITPQGIEMLYADPATYLQRYSKAKGMPNAAGFLSAPYDAALAMSRYGVLGDQRGDINIYSGDPKGYQEQLTDVENFLNDFNQPGASVNPQYYVEQIIDRAVTTDWENTINPETKNPYTPNQIIDETNKAVMAVGNLMPTDGQEWLASVLLQASTEYREGVADGSINLLEMSYAQFLRDQKGLVDNMR
jgi:hypothetical protein